MLIKRVNVAVKKSSSSLLLKQKQPKNIDREETPIYSCFSIYYKLLTMHDKAFARNGKCHFKYMSN